jgi:metal-responsive CopG/Arc/MetJ family transcriptional regulator
VLVAKTARVYVEIPTYLDDRLKDIAAELAVPRSQVIRAAIERYLLMKNKIKEKDSI